MHRQTTNKSYLLAILLHVLEIMPLSMRIRTFCKLIEVEILKEHTLNNSTVVIDGTSYFFELFRMANKQYPFGCDCNTFAQFLRRYLSMYTNSNVTCYFIFKGGNENLKKRLNYRTDCDISAREFNIKDQEKYAKNREIVLPIFVKDVFRQVVTEMGFNYSVCEFESKKEIIAFAQKNNCPIISFDAEFCFSGVPYIPHINIMFDELTGILKCGLFTLDRFLKKYQLTEEKLAVFVTLTDETKFPTDYFLNFIQTLETSVGNYKRNIKILKWLGKTPKERAVKTIFRYINSEDRANFKEVEAQVRDLIGRKETPGIATEYLDNGNKIDISENDPQWFEKGVASKHIAIPLVNLARSHVQLGSWAIADFDQDDAMLLSIDIIKYIYNLLTNFEKHELTFLSNKQPIPVSTTDSVQKPDYDAVSSPFENGWSRLKAGLFEHFLAETLQGVDLGLLEKLPEDARLLMIALVYFSRRKSEDVTCEVYSVLLSYVALSIVMDVDDGTNNNLEERDTGFPEKPLLDSITDKSMVTEADKLVARALLAEYFRHIGMEEAETIFDRKLLHPLVEFQHCLQNLNYLNVLCGGGLKGTVYSQTYSGSGVFRALRAMRAMRERGAGDDDGRRFLRQTLGPAATVLAFLHGLIEVYEELMYK